MKSFIELRGSFSSPVQYTRLCSSPSESQFVFPVTRPKCPSARRPPVSPADADRSVRPRSLLPPHSRL